MILIVDTTKHIGSFLIHVIETCRYRVGALLLAIAPQRSLNNLYALFSLSFLPVSFFSILFSIFSILLSAFLFSNPTFALPSYSMSLSTSSPNITQDIKVSPVGKTIIIPQTVTINSNNPHGIKLFISSKDDKLVPTKTTPVINTSTPISPVPGDISNPSILNMNSFGFALSNESDNPLSSNFSANNIYTSNDKNIKNTAKFSKLTNKHNPIEIYQNKSTITNKQLTVYYGTKINSVIDKGTYTLDILYTLIPNLAGTNTTPGQNNQEVLTIEEGNNDTLELTPAKLTKAQGNETLTINTTINTNLNISNETINNKHILIETKINNKPCTNIQVEQIASINGNEGNIIQTQNTEKPLTLTCTTPPNTPGKYNLTLKIAQNHNPQDTTLSNNINNANNKVLLNINKKNAAEYIEVTDMQSFTPTMCKNMGEHDVKYVKDTRDGELYTMAKLKDGKCWMTQNLRLKLDTNKTLTPADTDIASNWTPPRSTKENSGSGGSYGYGVDENWFNDNEGYKTVRSIYRTPTYSTHGVYYAHSAVTAQSANSIDTQGQNAPHSICPKGWRLPTSSSSSGQGDYWNMVRHYTGSNNSWTGSYSGSHTLISGTPSFPLSGYYYYGGYFNYVGSHGYFWSSTVYLSTHAYGLYQNSSGLVPHVNYYRYNGFSARCVVKEPSTVSDIQHMQDFTSQMCTKMTEHQTATLTDKRDGQQYTIAKLKDGKCWMTQNLRLKLDTSITLTSADTDLNNTTSWTPTHTTEQFSTSGGSNGQGSGSNWGSDYKADKSGFRPDNYTTHGVYYSHGSATANSARNLDNDGSEAPDSICPKGWRLPKTTTNSTTSDFYSMAQHYKSNASWEYNSGWSYWSGSHNMINTPIPNFQYSGYYYYGGSVLNIGSHGSWWASTIYDWSSAYRMTMGSSYIHPRHRTERLNGFNVRCMSR